MRRVLLSLLLLASFVPSLAAQTATTPPPGGRKKRVAIFDFDYATVQTASAAAFGTNVDVGKGISDLLVRHLVQDGTYSVIERKAMDKILAEQNFSNSDRADANSAAKIGRLLGVDAIIVGSITQFGNDNSSTSREMSRASVAGASSVANLSSLVSVLSSWTNPAARSSLAMKG